MAASGAISASVSSALATVSGAVTSTTTRSLARGPRTDRRTRLANEVVALGLVKPMPPADLGEQLKMRVTEQPVRGRHDQVMQAR